MALRGVRDRRQPPRRGDHSRLLRGIPVGILASCAGSGAGRAWLLGERIGRDRRPDPREFPEDAQGNGARDHQQRDHQHAVADDHYPWLHVDDGAVDPVLRRRDIALLRACAGDRHLLRHLLLGAGHGLARHVARRIA